MSQLKTSRKTLAGLYDFADDALAGAVGIRLMGITLPAFAQVLGFWATATNAVTGAVGATVSFGWITKSLAIPILDPVGFMVANIPGAFIVGTPLQGVNLQANPVKNNAGATDLAMFIGTNALLTGTIEFVVEFQEMPF